MLIRNITKITNDSFKKLNEDVNKLLLEDIDAVRKVFMGRFPDMSEEEFDEIIKLDPTYKEGSNSVGKYGKWLLGLYKKDNPLEYDVEEIYGLLSLYDNYKNDRKKEIEKDINKFKSIEELNDAVNNVDDAELSDRQQERELRNSKDIKKIFEDDTWEIWVPQSFAGSCTLGKGTAWCTAYSENDSFYKDYTSQGPLYIFINKQNPKEKYQLHVETRSFMDKDDRPENIEDVLSTDDKLKEFVYMNIYGYKVDKDGNFIYEGNNQVPTFVKSVVIEQWVTYIGKQAFAGCESLQSITIPDSVTYIGDSAFAGCKSLQSVTIPDSVEYIGSNAFAYCTSLQSITIPDLVTSIDFGAFSYCKSLQSINIPDSVISIDEYAFFDCASLQSITIPDSVTKIRYSSFAYCTSLQSITIPDSVTFIGNYAFDGCKSLQEVILENPNAGYTNDTFPEHTKIIKKGVNESLKNNKINQLMRAKRLMENNGYEVIKLNEDVNKLLLEDIDAVKKVFMSRFPDMSDEEFDEIINLDPTYDENRDSVGKYGKWLLGLYKKDYPLDHPLYDMEDIYNILKVYDKYKNDSAKDIEKDINKFKSISDLLDAVNNAGEVELSARQQERKLRKAYQDAKLIFSDDMWQIWVPETYAASCTLGKGTTWCTAYSQNDYYYNDYTRQGPLYVFINKQNPKEKYQLHVETYSFMDKDDRPADLEDVLSTDDKLKEFVEKKIDIDDFDLPEDIINVMEAVGCTPDEARHGLDYGDYVYYPGVHSPLDLLYEMEMYDGLDVLLEIFGDNAIDYEYIGEYVDDMHWEDDEGNKISAGEYWCGDEDADYEDIGMVYADGLSASELINFFGDSCVDRDSLADEIYSRGDFTFTEDGCVECSY